MSRILAQKKRYEPKFIFSTFKNDATVGIFIFIAVLVLKFSPFSIKINFIIAGIIVFFGILFVISDGFALLNKIFTFRGSLKNVSYYDSKMDRFFDVVSIKNNLAIRKDSSMIAYLKVTPKDLNIMSIDEQKDVISAYMQFINSLEDDIQIVSRSVPVDLDTWLYNIQNKIASRTDDKNAEYNLKRLEDFKKWVNNIIGEDVIRNRVFYIVIRYYGLKSLKGFALVRQFFYDLFGKEYSPTKINIKDFYDASKEINDRIFIYSEILERMGVTVERLNDNHILSMLSGYSNDIESIDTNYITPMMWHENDLSK